ncbi:MAG TPA: CAP domain-containing protein [Pyrinomonadaceae bacterium]|nr:CAP domain-containing protein [Pyrinomonadaceae bacterium]
MKHYLSTLPRLFLFFAFVLVGFSASIKADETNRLQVFENKTNVNGNFLIEGFALERLAYLNFERQVFDLINQKRREFGLKPLVWNESTARVARMHSENMATYNFFGHRGLDGKAVSGRADSIGLTKWRGIGENIASLRGYQKPMEQVITCWMNSPGHRENLLREKWRESGVGISRGSDGTYYFTQVFLKK